MTNNYHKFKIAKHKKAILITGNQKYYNRFQTNHLKGCDTGFGNALALKLNAYGFRVFATVLDPKSVGAQNLLIDSCSPDMTHVMRMDVTNDDEVCAVYQQVKSDLDSRGEELWSVVNNAGVITYGPLDWGTIDSYRHVMEVNAIGMVRVSRTFLPLIRQSKGRFVNVVSMAGRFTLPYLAAYSMSKHAAIAFSDALRRETRKYGIRVSTIEPMAYKTQMISESFVKNSVDKNWNETNDEVKRVYGKKFLDQFKHMFKNQWNLGENIYEVIDLMIDAIENKNPYSRYEAVPGNWFKKFGISMWKYVPAEIIDKIIFMQEQRYLHQVYQ